MTSSRLLFKALLALLISSPVMLLILALDQQTLTLNATSLNENQLADIQQLLIDHDPRLLINTDDQAIILSENELNALLNYSRSSFPALKNWALSASLMSETLIISASLPVPANPFGSYINVNIQAVQDGNLIRIAAVEIGAVHIPSSLYPPLFELIQNTLQENGNYQLFTTLLASVKNISLEQNQVSIILNWQSDNLENIRDQARQVFISSEEITRLIRYQDELTAISQSFPSATRTVSLNDFLRPMFTRASINSSAGADPREENRAIFIIMTAYLTELRLEHLIGPFDENEISSPRQLRVVTGARRDISQHIVGSAAITASAGANVMNILSVYKEVHDSRYRTGFSFSDITANQVGSTLGRLSEQSIASALQLQKMMSNSQSETDYMPLVGRYDGVTEQEFITLYENRNSEQYKQRIIGINQEISQRPFFQAFNLNANLDTE